MNRCGGGWTTLQKGSGLFDCTVYQPLTIDCVHIGQRDGWLCWGAPSLGPRLSPLKTGGGESLGNIHVKSCRLPAPGFGGPNQIAEQNHVNT